MSFTNGDFETGNLTGWTAITGGDTPGTVAVNTDAKQTGTYGCELKTSCQASYTCAAGIYSNDIATSFVNFNVPYRMVAGSAGVLHVFMRVHNSSHAHVWLEVATLSWSSGSWTGGVTVTKSGISLGSNHWDEDGTTSIKVTLTSSAVVI